MLFAVELDRRWSKDGIRGYAVHPGVVVGTSLNSAAGPEALRAMGLIDEAGRPIIDPEQGKRVGMFRRGTSQSMRRTVEAPRPPMNDNGFMIGWRAQSRRSSKRPSGRRRR